MLFGLGGDGSRVMRQKNPGCVEANPSGVWLLQDGQESVMRSGMTVVEVILAQSILTIDCLRYCTSWCCCVQFDAGDGVDRLVTCAVFQICVEN